MIQHLRARPVLAEHQSSVSSTPTFGSTQPPVSLVPPLASAGTHTTQMKI